jgi:hypothetical protein
MRFLGNYSGVNLNKREVPLIVSLTSYRERFGDLPKTIYSLLNQDLKPDKIILWLSKDHEELLNLPYDITRFIKNGLEIRFVEDISSYTKVIYTFQEFKSAVIVTADDDIYYPQNWLRKLYLSYISHPEDIHVHRAHRVKYSNGKFMPYRKWAKQITEENARFDNFLTGVGGVLYPPNCFSNEALRKDVFLQYARRADDLWFWVMALTHNRKIRVVKNHIKTLICTNVFNQLFAKRLYSTNSRMGNDIQLKNLMKFYGQNVINKL